SAAAGEDDLISRAVQERRDLLPRPVDGGGRLPAIAVAARRVAEILLDKRQHCSANAGRDRRRRVVVEIDRQRRISRGNAIVLPEMYRRLHLIVPHLRYGTTWPDMLLSSWTIGPWEGAGCMEG